MPARPRLPDPHQLLLITNSCGRAWYIKQLLYGHNKSVRSVRIRCTFPDGCVGEFYLRLYHVEVQADIPLPLAFANAVQNLPREAVERWKSEHRRYLSGRPLLY